MVTSGAKDSRGEVALDIGALLPGGTQRHAGFQGSAMRGFDQIESQVMQRAIFYFKSHDFRYDFSRAQSIPCLALCLGTTDLSAVSSRPIIL